MYDIVAPAVGCQENTANSSLLWNLAAPDDMMFPSPEILYNMSNCSDTIDFPQPYINIVLHTINLYITPVIIVVGITGNLLNFLVFATTHLKTQSSSVYLAFLSVADIGFLLALFIIWLQHINVPIFNTDVLCQLVVYATYTCKFMSVWLVASFTIERFIIVRHPFLRRKLCTTRGAKLVVLSFTVFALVAYSFSTWTSGVVTLPIGLSHCMPLPKYYHLITVCEILDFIFTLLIPCFIIGMLNVRIVLKINMFRKRQARKADTVTNTLPLMARDRMRPSFVETSFSAEGTLQFTFKSRTTSTTDKNYELCTKTSLLTMRKRSQNRTAKMLLVVSSVFLVLNLPSHVMRLQAFIRRTVASHQTMQEPMEDDVRWSELLLIPYHLTFAINFFLYSVCGRPFRKGLKCVYNRFKYKLKTCYFKTNISSQHRNSSIN